MAKLFSCFDIRRFYIRINKIWKSHAKGLPLQNVKDDIDAFHKLQKSRHYFRGVSLHPLLFGAYTYINPSFLLVIP